MELLRDGLAQELPELDSELAGRLGLRFCAAPLGNTAIDLVTGVIGTRTGALTQSLRAHGGGFSSGGDPMLAVAAANAATDQIVWPASSTLRGGTAVQQGTLLCLGQITELVSARQYLFGSSMNVDGSGMGLRISSGLSGSAGSIMRSKSGSTAVGWSTGQILGATPGLQTHFFGYAYDSNGVAGTWLGARQGEDWTGGTAFGTGNTNRKALLFTDYDAGSYANTKAVAVGLFLIFDRRLTVEQYQALYDEPRQLFKPLRVWVPVAASAPGGTTYNVSLTEAATAADAASTAASFAAAASEPITAADLVACTLAALAQQAEAVAAADAVSTAGAKSAAVAEAATAADTLAASLVALAQLLESVSASDTASTGPVVTASQAEPVTLVDLARAVHQLAAQVAEAASAADAITAVRQMAALITEPATAADSATAGGAVTHSASLTEVLALADAVAAAIANGHLVHAAISIARLARTATPGTRPAQLATGRRPTQ